MSDPKVLVALDFTNRDAVFKLVDQLSPLDCRLKVGKELFTYEGPGLVKELVARGFDVFLDLKFHDIPNTVAGAVRAAAELGVWMVNVHASGGVKMMEAAKQALADFDVPPKLIAVTVLTSTSQADFEAMGGVGSIDEKVLSLASSAASAGLDGVVCSAREVVTLRAALGDEFLLVTPGIRPSGDSLGDQTRVMTPAQALSAGSSYLVIGRPITQASDPKAKLFDINSEV